MEKSKILIQAVTPVMGRLNEKIKALGLRRDSYLNTVFRTEAANLVNELGDKRNSDTAKNYLWAQLRNLPTTSVSIMLSKDVIVVIDTACSKINLPRDCFVNRVFFFLAAEAKHLESAGISIASVMSHVADDLRVNALDNASLFLSDPFHELRQFMKANETTLYEWKFERKVIGLNCYLEDSSVPGADGYMDLETMLASIGD